MTGLDPLGSRRLIAGALGGVLFWRFVAHMAGLPPMVGTAVGLAAPLTHAIESRSSARLPAPLKSAVNVAEAYGGGGHFDVAGCTIPNTSKAIKGLLNNLERIID